MVAGIASVSGIEHVGLDAPAMLGHAELVPGLRVVGERSHGVGQPISEVAAISRLERSEFDDHHAERHQEQQIASTISAA